VSQTVWVLTVTQANNSTNIGLVEDRDTQGRHCTQVSGQFGQEDLNTDRLLQVFC